MEISMFEAIKKQNNFLSSNELIKKAMLKRRRLARASIAKIQGTVYQEIKVIK